MIVRLAQSEEAPKHVGPIEIAKVAVGDRNLVEIKVPGPIQGDPLTHQIPVVVVASNLGRLPAIEV